MLARVADVSVLADLASAPGRTGLFFDLDGTLSPIVARPEDSFVPGETRAEIERLAARYRLVACVTGRAGEAARRILGVGGVTYVGEHGLELEPAAEKWRAPLALFLTTVSWPEADVENKGLTASLHYRTVADEDAARADLEAIAERARNEGFRARFGRKVLELLPPVDASKRSAVLHLLEREGLDRALYAGDDTTDLDAFAALEGLELAVRVAVSSAEGPEALRAQADVVVASPDELAALLRLL
jgi:trehalose 6-phosphate phosphatase